MKEDTNHYTAAHPQQQYAMRRANDQDASRVDELILFGLLTSCCCIWLNSLGGRYLWRRLLILPSCFDLRPLPCDLPEVLPSPLGSGLPRPLPPPPPPDSPAFFAASSLSFRSLRLRTINACHSASGAFASSSVASRTWVVRTNTNTEGAGTNMEGWQTTGETQGSRDTGNG